MAIAAFPAISEIVPESTDNALPSPLVLTEGRLVVKVCVLGSKPERLSVALNGTVTALVYQPLLPNVPVGTPAVITGAVLSIFISLGLVAPLVATLPALSTHAEAGAVTD